MTAKRVVNYNECGFLIPKQENWQDVHKSVFDIAVDGKDVSSKREFIYSVTDHPVLEKNLFVTLRSQSKLSNSLSMTEAEVVLEKGKSITVKLDISARKSVSNSTQTAGDKPVRNKCTYVNPTDFESWISNLLRGRGFDTTKVNFFSVEKRPVQKRENEFFIPKVSFLLEGIITDPDLLAEAWMSGVGRSRGYGLGMLELFPND